MTVYSRSDLATQTLKEAGLIDPRMSPDADDLSDVETIVASRYASLVVNGIAIPNGSDEAVPLEWLVPLASYCAMFMQTFGVPAPTRQQIDGAEAILRRMSSRGPTGTVQQADYF